ncbi:MAG TPA: hypothetical protein VFY24_10290 [Azospira sp.]|nr:hypothetical protein [Azospira sp.]
MAPGRFVFLSLLAAFLAACSSYASYAGYGLRPGVATEAEVRARMGEPAMRWTLPDGGGQLAYPRGPAGFHTWMAFIDAGGKLERLVNVLDQPYFARIQPGMSQAEVLQLLGPPQPQWTAYFAARDELVWEWRYCDSWGEAARFDVLFDATKKTVRTTYSITEGLKTDYRITCGR